MTWTLKLNEQGGLIYWIYINPPCERVFYYQLSLFCGTREPMPSVSVPWSLVDRGPSTLQHLQSLWWSTGAGWWVLNGGGEWGRWRTFDECILYNLYTYNGVILLSIGVYSLKIRVPWRKTTRNNVTRRTSDERLRGGVSTFDIVEILLG